MRVLVTGANGFIGRVVEHNLLRHGHEVIGLIRRPGGRAGEGVHECIADLRDRAALAQALIDAEPDGVVHLAAAATVRESWLDPAGYFETNVGGTVNLLQVLSGIGARIPVVLTSTNAVYGSGSTGALSEDCPARPDTPYAASKWSAEQVIYYQARTGTVGATILRLFNVAGAYHGVSDPNTTRIIGAALRVAAGEIDHVTLNGDGSATREFTHVADVADAIRLALGETAIGTAQTFNVGTGVGVSMAQVLAVAREVTGHPIPVVHMPQEDEPQMLISDPTRAHEVLKWNPERSSIETIVRDAWSARTAP